jgi:hypothetical protein
MFTTLSTVFADTRRNKANILDDRRRRRCNPEEVADTRSRGPMAA